ncbi:MAG: ABC transporter permease subunit [Burkholderiales bacterium]
MTRSTATIAYYVQVEALRSGLPWLAGGCAIGALGLAGFLSQVAIIESTQLLASVAGALLRACAVFLIATQVVASIAREQNDKGLELALALPLSRHTWYLGKLLGFACAGTLLAAVFAAPLLCWAAPANVAAWGLSLAAELVVVAAAALFFASALTQAAAAIAATLGFYLLSRALPAIQAIAAGPLSGDTSGAHAARWTVDALALLLPRLDVVTRGDWLLYGTPPAAELAPAVGGLAVYLVLLVAAGLFDLSRRNL